MGMSEEGSEVWMDNDWKVEDQTLVVKPLMLRCV